MSMSKYATQADYWKAKVQAVHPTAYQYTPSQKTWRICLMDGDGIKTLGVGRSEVASWKNAFYDLEPQNYEGKP